MAKEEKKNDKLAKSGPADLTIDVPVAAPEGYEKSVRGGSFVGYWRAAEGDVIDCILRGPAPDRVQEKSQSQYGVALVELNCDVIATASAKQLEGRDMSRWQPGPKNRKGEDTFLTKATKGEIICVSIREGIKDEMMLPEGTCVWLRVGKQRAIPGTDRMMYDYEKYVKSPKGASPTGSNSRAQQNAVPFD